MKLKLCKRGFTLAETLIALTVLGIVAAVTVPNLMRKQIERTNKVKIKKAMATYESALNKIVVENDLKSDAALYGENSNFASEGECTKTTNYFKSTEKINDCVFKTSDGIWWDISNILRPVIYLKKEGISQNNTTSITVKANDEKDKTAYVMVGRFDINGALRINDLGYEKDNSINDSSGNNSYIQVAKLYGLKLSELSKCKAKKEDTCTVNSMTFEKTTLNGNDYYISNTKLNGESIRAETKSEENCKTSLNANTSAQNCYTDGDFWNVMKRKCEASGARMANYEETKAAAIQGKLSSTRYWTSDIVVHSGYGWNMGVTFNAGVEDLNNDRQTRGTSTLNNTNGNTMCILNE